MFRFAMIQFVTCKFAMFGFATLFEATMFVFAIASSHLITSFCLCFLQEVNASTVMTMAKLPPCHIFLFLKGEQLFLYCHHCSFFFFYYLALLYPMYPIPCFHLTPHVLTLLLVFISLCLYLTPLSLPYSVYIPYSLIYMCIFPLFFRSFLSYQSLEPTTNPPSFIVIEWKVAILL